MSQAKGSAYIEMKNTKVICSVYPFLCKIITLQGWMTISSRWSLCFVNFDWTTSTFCMQDRNLSTGESYPNFELPGTQTESVETLTLIHYLNYNLQ